MNNHPAFRTFKMFMEGVEMVNHDFRFALFINIGKHENLTSYTLNRYGMRGNPLFARIHF